MQNRQKVSLQLPPYQPIYTKSINLYIGNFWDVIYGIKTSPSSPLDQNLHVSNAKEVKIEVEKFKKSSIPEFIEPCFTWDPTAVKGL